MKKVTIILFVLLVSSVHCFAAAPALDLKATWFGDAMIRGTYVSNADGSNNPKDKFFLETDFNIGIKLDIIKDLSVTVRAAIFDTDMGRMNERWDRTYESMAGSATRPAKGNAFELDDMFRIERAFVTYAFGWDRGENVPKPFSVQLGRLFSAPYGHNYGKEFGRRDGAILTYNIDRNFSVRGFYYARKESSGRDSFPLGKSSMDWHTYGLVGAYFNRTDSGRIDLFTAAIDINNNPACDSAWSNEPCLSLGTPTPTEVGDKRNKRYFTSIYGQMVNRTGFSWKAEIMMDYRDVYASTSSKGVGEYVLWGALFQPWYDWEKFRVGGRFIYASWDDKHNTGFDWGGEFVTTGENIQDTMDIIHDWLFDYRLKGVNMAQINGMYRITPKWHVLGYASFFFSSIQDADQYATGNNVTAFSGRDATAFGRSTTAFEMDFVLRYIISPKMYIDLSYAVLQMYDRVQPQVMDYSQGKPVVLRQFAKHQKADPIHMVYMKMMLQF